jgi:hypothetical protein
LRAAERTVPLEVVPVGGVAPGPGPDAELGHRHAGPAQHHLAAVLHRRALGRHRAGRAKRCCSPLAEEREAAATSRAAGDLQGHQDGSRGRNSRGVASGRGMVVFLARRVAAKRARFVWPREEGGGSRGGAGDRARARGAQPDALSFLLFFRAFRTEVIRCGSLHSKN